MSFFILKADYTISKESILETNKHLLSDYASAVLFMGQGKQLLGQVKYGDAGFLHHWRLM